MCKLQKKIAKKVKAIAWWGRIYVTGKDEVGSLLFFTLSLVVVLLDF